MNWFFKSTRKAVSSGQRLTLRRLAIENLEDRRVKSVNPLLGGGLAIQPIGVLAADPLPPQAEGSITWNSSTGVVTIEGTDNHDDSVKIYINHRAGNGAGNIPDLLTVQLGNINTPQVRVFDPNAVQQIIFRGYGGNDTFDNRTGIDSIVDGGAGNDVLLGGSGGDSIWGGEGDDFIDGRQGVDLLLGQGGNDALFGDDGDDSLYGGAGVDRLFGGNGNDRLFGEAGNDVLYGEAGSDSFVDTLGSNTKYTDYGPTYTVSASGFVSFDFFDRYLKDADVRSLARLEYRDGVLDRSDILNIYTQISTDGVVSVIPHIGTVNTNEFADLKAMLSTQINFQTDTRFFATKIANGDRANQWYQDAALGNLTAGVSGDRLNKLVDKWFQGGDLPWAEDDSLSTLRYEQASGSLFVNGPNYDDVDQGSISDCYFLAALGEVAKHSPSTIDSMFSDNGDGTWTVRFYRGGVANYVTVNRELPVLGHGFSAPWAAGWGMDAMGFQKNVDDPTNELWVALAEKAYAQLNESGWIGQDGTNSYSGIEFGQPSTALSQIAGKTPTTHSLNWIFSPPDSAEVIGALNAGLAVTLSSKQSPASNLITPNHVYMVIGYNASTQMFQLFNPHGFWNNDSPNGGKQSPVIEASWSAILSNFDAWTGVLI